jgi:hypothetical protein
MATAPLGTMGSWVLAGSAAFWSEDCQAALIACGIDPANHGTYNDRAKAQAAVRRDYAASRIKEARKRPGRDHEPNCGLHPRKRTPKMQCTCIHSTSQQVFDDCEQLGMRKPPKGQGRPGGWLLGISESGHMTQNALFQAKRDDPCSNIPPEGKDGGAYGYQSEKAFCVDHAGMAIGRYGQPSYGVHASVAEEENAKAEELREKYGTGRVPESEIKDSREGNIEKTVRPGSPRTNSPELDPKAGGQMQAIAERREKLAGEMRQQAKDAGQTGVVKKVDAYSKPNGKGGRTATRKAQETAKKCIREKCEEADDVMRADCVDEHSSVGKAIKKENARREAKGETPLLKPFSEMSKKEQKEWLEKAKVDDKVDNATKRAKEGPGKTADQKRACLEYQGNVLAQKLAKNGKFPPMAGRAPGPAAEGEGDGIGVGTTSV